MFSSCSVYGPHHFLLHFSISLNILNSFFKTRVRYRIEDYSLCLHSCENCSSMLKTLLIPAIFFTVYLLISVAATAADDGEEAGLSICNCDEDDNIITYETILESQRIADYLIAIAYFSIPIELIYFITRTNVPSLYNWVIYEFIAFIVLCGMTHLLSGFTYGPHFPWIMTAVTIFKMLTGIVSFLTAISLVTLLPLLLKAKVREFMLSKKTKELDREVGIIMKQTETSLHVRMLTEKIRTSLDRHTILYTTLVELSKTLGLTNCAVWIPNETKTEMNLTHELRMDDVNEGGFKFSIPISEDDVVRIKRTEEVNMLNGDSVLASVTSRGKPGPTVGIRVPMLRVCNFKGGTPEVSGGSRKKFQLPPLLPEAIHMCYAILVCVLPFKEWSYQELEIVKVVADQVAVAISHAVILEESQLMREKLAKQNKALQVARENALRANQAKAAFEEMISDAMTKPVRSILALLLPVGKLQEKQKVIVDVMKMLLEIVGGGGGEEKKVHCFSLHCVVKEVVCLVRCLCIGNGFGFVIKVDRALPDYVVGDDRKVFQVVLHMLGSLMKRKIKGIVSLLVLSEEVNQDAVWRHCYEKEYVEIRFGFEVVSEGGERSSGSSRPEEEEDLNAGKNVVKFMQGDILVVEDGQGLTKSLSVVFRFQLRRSILSRGGGYSGESTPPSTSNFRKGEM